MFSAYMTTITKNSQFLHDYTCINIMQQLHINVNNYFFASYLQVNKS